MIMSTQCSLRSPFFFAAKKPVWLHLVGLTWYQKSSKPNRTTSKFFVCFLSLSALTHRTTMATGFETADSLRAGSLSAVGEKGCLPLSQIIQMEWSLCKGKRFSGVSTKHWPPVNWPPTDPLLTPYWPPTDPLLTPYWLPIKSMGKWKLKKPRTINGTRFKFINKFSLPETFKIADAMQISDSCFPFTL